ncbi:uncharacterized protein LOC109795372 [Cajanus cajan]|uniref:Uncharacterized protein n=1 Tax=Cajanus cajan TaxID=3821 RepID=A0A151U012_CAJCA|nr:uncharacterized protein LOC109795372 [Cajanus cajan]KYP72615.1 hypothetical protein KK1_005211 [Cajanus cajan]
MENLRRHFSKKKDACSVIGRVKRNGHCKKHPKHQQSPGVCSLCLREKLIQLSSSNSPTIFTNASSTSSSSSSLSSYYSSASTTSSCASPMPCFCFTTQGKSSSSVSIFLLSGNHGIVKSRCRSLDHIVPRRRDHCEGGADNRNKSVDKSGFWFNLLRPKSKRMTKEYCSEDTKLVPSMSIKIRETVV